ncbi:hypothetical protein OG394_21035 [Kribbella sp. NBC_01245]|uniref:hypothetical protein n=1 Tax=Kribbella sp. NBC_01245 TaxID=2903578 RepID=UPI002E2C6324|nr:hypothetical protein [Kribbella sp. NBC_01245]
MTVVVLVVTGVSLVLAGFAWLPRSGSKAQGVLTAVMVVALAAVGVLLLFRATDTSGWDEQVRATLILVAGGLAVAGGGPLTTSVLALVDRGNPRSLSTQRAGEILRGGALIGALERGAIFGSMVAGWPEGIAITLAIKGLARYPELSDPDQIDPDKPDPGAARAVAERFIIGTFTSVLWAVGCAALLLT